MRATLHGNTHPRFARKMPPQSLCLSAHAPFFHHFGILQPAVATVTIPNVNAHSHGRFLALFLYCLAAILLHRLVSFSTSSACGQLSCSARPAVSFHLPAAVPVRANLLFYAILSVPFGPAA